MKIPRHLWRALTPDQRKSVIRLVEFFYYLNKISLVHKFARTVLNLPSGIFISIVAVLFGVISWIVSPTELIAIPTGFLFGFLIAATLRLLIPPKKKDTVFVWFT